MKIRLLITSVVIIVGALSYGVFLQIHKSTPTPAPVATTSDVVHCSNDAKLCADGSTVLRSGPQCEFVACPSAYGEQSNWQTTKDESSGVTFKYPVTFGNSNYVTAREWPPKVTVSKEAYTCVPTVDSKASAVTTYEKIIEGTAYCVSEQKEGAAGSTYTEYHVSSAKEDKTFTMSFTIQTVQCMNYDGSQQSACQAAQASFKVEELVDAIAHTIQ